MYRLFKPALMGFSLTSLFFYPLTMSLFGNGQYYMTWKILNALEYLGTFIIIFLTLSAIIAFIESLKNRLLRTSILIFIAFFPFLFFSIHLLRQFINKSLLVNFAEYLFSTYGIIFFCLLFLLLIYKKNIWIKKLYESIVFTIMALSPLSLLSIGILFLYGFNGHKDYIGELDDLINKKTEEMVQNNLHVFLFDELDYSILYDKFGKVKKKYKNIYNFSNKSINLHNARSPGSATLQSIPQLLIGKRINNIRVCQDTLCSLDDKENKILDTKENVFNIAKKYNFKTTLIGWAHKYCELYKNSLDYCRSYGIYNYSSFSKSFSLLNPIYTNIILLPYQMPFGLLKNIVYSNLHHKNAQNTHNLNLEIIKKAKHNSIFNFVHYAIPHSPFIYKNNVYTPDKRPFEQNKKKYEDQLLYVDKLFGDLIANIKKTGKLKYSTIILLSDHGFRKILPVNQQDHVPMIVYKGDKPEYLEIFHEVRIEEYLLYLIKDNFKKTLLEVNDISSN